MTNSTSNPKYAVLNPFDTVYTILFIFLILDFLVKAFISCFAVESLEMSFYKAFIFFFLSYQLLRIYYYLKNFEIEISANGDSHFLELLPEKIQPWEKIVRVILAAILVLFAKIQDFFTFNALNFSLGTLFFAFLFLTIWDLIVISGLKLEISKLAKEDGTLTDTQAMKSGRLFFYWKNDDKALDVLNIKHYFRNFKFWERCLGLVASLIAFIFLIFTSDNKIYFFPVLLLVISIICIILFPFLGKLKINELHYDDVFKELGKNIIEPICKPVINLINNLKNKTMDRTTEKKWQIGVIATIIVIFASLIIWKVWDNSPKEAFSNTTTVKIATSKNLWCAMTLIALDKGYFEAEGLKPDVNYQAAGRLCMDALVGGSVDIANVVETNIAYQALNNTTDLEIHCRIALTNDYAILTTQKSQIFTPQDFKNKSISFAQATGAESFLFWFMEHNDLLDKSIKLIPLQPVGIIDNFLGGGSDAVTTWEPFVSTIRNQKKDLGTSYMADSIGFKGIMTVATKDSWASNNKNTIDAYNRAMQKASIFLKDSTISAQTILSRETGIPIETIANIWGNFDYEYTTNLDKEKVLIADVIKRIKLMYPDKRNIIEQDIERYFK